VEDKNRLKSGFQTALGASLFQVALALTFYFLYTHFNSPLILLETFHVAIGIPIFAILLLLFHQRYREILEKEEVEELSKREDAIFKEEESLLVSRLRLQQTEKWGVPVLGVIILCLFIYVPLRAIYYFRGNPIVYEADLQISLLILGLTFLIFLPSRYVIGKSREKQLKDLQVIGTYLGVNALFTGLIAISVALRFFGITRIEWFVFYILCLLLGLTGIEYLFNFIISFYRTAGAPRRIILDSRIYYFLSTPEEVIPSFSEIIDRQFGFHITQTWFYQFIKNRIIPLLMLGGFLLYILTSMVIVQPHEKAFIEFLGRPVGSQKINPKSEIAPSPKLGSVGDRNPKIFGPGLHLKFPFPIGTAKIYDVDRIKNVRVGVKGEEGERILWTEKHYEEEFNWMIASQESISQSTSATVPVNFLAGTIWIYYKINPDQLFNYAYKHSEPEKLLEGVIYNQFTKMVMSIDFFDIMNVKRLPLADTLKNKVQEEVNRKELGVEIISVSLEGIHPPVEIASSFEKVVGATEKKEALILGAESYSNRELTLADYDASSIKTDAKSYKLVRTLESEARGEEFLKKLLAYEENPRIFKYRYYLKSLEEGLISPNKYIVISPDSNRDVTILNMEKAALPDILSLGLEAEKKEMEK
jgi:regulator of protease activity HflC (stomatin/prohibitin superfamily)